MKKVPSVDKPRAKGNKNKKSSDNQQTQDTQNEYEKALQFDDEEKDNEDDIDFLEGDQESDLEDDTGEGDENITRTDKKGRMRTITKRKRNRAAIAQQLAKQAAAKKASEKTSRSAKGVKGKKTPGVLEDDSTEEDIQGKHKFDSFGGGNGDGDNSQDQNQDHNEDNPEPESLENAPNNKPQNGPKQAIHIPTITDMVTEESAREKGKQNVMGYLRYFLEVPSPTKDEKQMLKKILMTLLRQCAMGVKQFAKDTKQHQSLGKSATICKYALSALEADQITQAKDLVRMITPK